MTIFPTTVRPNTQVMKQTILCLTRTYLVAPAACIGLVALNGCREGDQPAPEPQSQQEIHWGYEGDVGPEYWADLSPEFALCREGREQSPIDLDFAVAVDDTVDQVKGETVLNVSQRDAVLDLIDNGHTIQVTNNLPLAISIAGEQFDLVQYHFHSPSEHTIAGQHYPLEVHFVHQSADGALAVVGLLVRVGEHNPVWEPVLSALPSGPGDARQVERVELDLDQVPPLPHHYFRYKGSLTTPPCSEGVEWIVMAEPREISEMQMNAITSHLAGNNRPVQSIGSRQVGEVIVSSAADE
jgi:carbonic anhydrase